MAAIFSSQTEFDECASIFDLSARSVCFAVYTSMEVFYSFQIVLGKSLVEVAERVVPCLRLALLTPDEIKEVESDNDRDRFIPVSITWE